MTLTVRLASWNVVYQMSNWKPGEGSVRGTSSSRLYALIKRFKMAIVSGTWATLQVRSWKKFHLHKLHGPKWHNDNLLQINNQILITGMYWTGVFSVACVLGVLLGNAIICLMSLSFCLLLQHSRVISVIVDLKLFCSNWSNSLPPSPYRCRMPVR